MADPRIDQAREERNRAAQDAGNWKTRALEAESELDSLRSKVEAEMKALENGGCFNLADRLQALLDDHPESKGGETSDQSSA